MSAAPFVSCSRSRRLRNAATERRLYDESQHGNKQFVSIEACKFELLIEQVQVLAMAVHTFMIYGPQPHCPCTTLGGQGGFNTDWANDMSGKSTQLAECNSAQSPFKEMQSSSTELCPVGTRPASTPMAAEAEHSAESLANPFSACLAGTSADRALTVAAHVAHMDEAAPVDVPRSVAPRNDQDIQGRLPRDVLQALQEFLGSVVPMRRKIYLAAVADEQKHTGHPRSLQLSAGRKQHVINNLVTEIEKVAVAQFQNKADVCGLTEVPFKADGGLLRTQIQQFVATAVQHEEDKILQLAY